MYRYRERDRDCSSDSDDEGILKLNKVHGDLPAASSVMDMDSKPETTMVNKSTKRKVNNIWASVAQEQTINEDMCKVNMNKKLADRLGWDRGCESYDFMRKELDTRPDTETDEEIDLDYGVSDIENEFEEETIGEKPAKKTPSKVPMVERLEDANKIAREVARKLREPKIDLLERTVQIVGRKKVFDLLHMTEDIEESGGLLIINGTRRRTPGGVFFFQLRKDRHISKKQKDLIFSEDKARYMEVKKSQKKLARKKNKRTTRNQDKMEMEETESVQCTTESIKEPSEISEAGVEDEKPSEQTSDVELEEGEIE